MRETSVLEPGRVRRVLAMLDPADRRAALKDWRCLPRRRPS